MASKGACSSDSVRGRFGGQSFSFLAFSIDVAAHKIGSARHQQGGKGTQLREGASMGIHGLSTMKCSRAVRVWKCKVHGPVLIRVPSPPPPAGAGRRRERHRPHHRLLAHVSALLRSAAGARACVRRPRTAGRLASVPYQFYTRHLHPSQTSHLPNLKPPATRPWTWPSPRR